MKVAELINRVDPEAVCKSYTDNYECRGWGKVESFLEFRDRLNSFVGIREGDDQFKAIVQWIVQDWSKIGSGKITSIDEYFSVGGRKVNDPEQVWSMSMTDWGVWKEMEVEDETEKNLTEAELAAHIYYEMTWFGWPEQATEHRDNLMDQMEKIDRDFSGWKDGDPMPEGYKDMSDFLKDLDDE